MGKDIYSIIFSKVQSFKIDRWLSEDGVSVDFYILYRGLLDGWKGEYFHDKCNNKSATITVIRSTGGFIFGGFTEKSWTSYGVGCYSDKDFSFSLKSQSN